MQSILVTGGGGFIGHHLVNRLMQDYRVVIIDNLSSGKSISEHQKAIFYREDVRDKETIADIVKKERIDTCIHLAAISSVSQSLVDANDITSVNVDGTISILDACAIGNVSRLIFASSAAVYGNAEMQPVSENDELKPLSPYGESKVAGEKLVASYHKSGKILHAVLLRFFNVYGDGQNLQYAGVITKFAERLSKGLPPIIYGDGKQTRDFISISDIVDAILLAMQSDISGTFNIGTGKATTIEELAKKMIGIVGLDLEPIYIQSNKHDIMHSCADTRKANSKLNFKAKMDVNLDLESLTDVKE